MPQAILKVTPEFLAMMLKSAGEGGRRCFEVIKNALPKDTEVVSLSADGSTIFVLLESASFAEVKEGDVPVLSSPILRTVYDDLIPVDG